MSPLGNLTVLSVKNITYCVMLEPAREIYFKSKDLSIQTVLDDGNLRVGFVKFFTHVGICNQIQDEHRLCIVCLISCTLSSVQ